MNRNSSTYYYLDVANQFFLILIFALVPIYFTSLIHNSFTIEKHVIFRFCTLAMLGISAIKYASCPSRNKLPKIFWLVPLFGLVGILSTIFSINPPVSLWGIHLRMDGLVNMLFLVVFFVLTYLQIDTKAKLKQVMLTIALTSIIPVAYAILQKLGADPLGWKDIVVAERVFGTTGNPAYLGAYLLFTIPVTFYMILKSKALKSYFYFVLMVAQIVVLILTWTRAAYLALGVELTILSILYFWIYQKKRMAYAICAVVVAVLLFVGALNVSADFAKMFEGNRYIERLSQITQMSEGTGKDRLEMWKVSVKAIKERPILGAGFSQYIQYFNKYYPNYMDSRPDKDRYSNYSHNLWLDTGVAHGLLGILILLSIYLLFIYLGVRKIWESETRIQKFLYLSLVTALLGYLIQAMFNIETIITWVYSFGLLAILLASMNISDEYNSEKDKPASPLKLIGLTFLVVASLFGVYYLAINPWSADKNYFYVNNSDQPLNEKLKLAEQALVYTPYFEYSYVRLGDIYASQVDFNKPDEAKLIFEKTIDYINKATAINPLNYKNYMSLATIYGTWAQMDNTKLAQAEENFAKAKELSPDRLGFHWAKGATYLDLGMYDEAEAEFVEAQKLNPEVGESYFHLAEISFLNNNLEEAGKLLDTSALKGYTYDKLKLYQDLALLNYKHGYYNVAKEMAELANEISVTEMTAMIEIQANLELDNSEVANILLNEYSKLVPGLGEKFGK